MFETDVQKLIHREQDADLVRHHYNRRSLWGTDSMLYRRAHPMAWKSVSGNYQNWEVPTARIATTDADSPGGEAERLFYSEDLTIWLSRRRESMPHFFRNCNADEVHLISQGRMTFETDFGVLEAQDRDIVIIPKGVTYRIVMPAPRDTLRIVFESEPEIFLVPTELIDHFYGKGRAPVDPAKVQTPTLLHDAPSDGPFEVRVKYRGAFSDFVGETTMITYDHYPLDVERIEGAPQVVKFSVADVERFPGTPVPFIAAAYLDNRQNLAFTFNLSGGGFDAPAHRDPDVDELRYSSSGPVMGTFVFTPQGVDHGNGRGYTNRNRNRPLSPYDEGDAIAVYTLKPLKGTAVAHERSKPFMA